MMRRILWPILFAALMAHPAGAGIENAGTTGANFLSVGSGAGVLGMGGATLGGFADLGSVSWNVASLGLLGEPQFAFSHAPIAGGGAQDWMSYGGRMGRSPTRWAANALYQGDGAFEGRDAFGNPTGSFNASSMAFGATFARPINQSVTLGFGGKIVSEKLADVSGFGGTFDAGVLVQQGAFGFGLAAQNIGGRMSYTHTYYSMPTNIGAGVSYVHPTSGLRLALDFNHPSAYYNDVRAGVEWMWRGRVAVRTGFRHELGGTSNDALNGPTFGMGAGVRGLWFDYGYLASSNGDAQQRIALRVSPRALNPGASMNPMGASASGRQSPLVAEVVPPAPKSEVMAPKSVAPAPSRAPELASMVPPPQAPAPKSLATKAATLPIVTPPAVAAQPTTSPAPETAHPETMKPTATPVGVSASRPTSIEPAPVEPAAPAPSQAIVKLTPAYTAPALQFAPARTRLEKVHVKSGETMVSIARRSNTSVAAIMMENNLVSDQVKVGQVLRIPNHK